MSDVIYQKRKKEKKETSHKMPDELCVFSYQALPTCATWPGWISRWHEKITKRFFELFRDST